ncbi:MAG: nucleotidyltransferase domain-containing protein [Paracoccaceae bacterium]
MDSYLGPLAALDHVKAIFLSGSHARGTSDMWSDLDLVLVVDRQDHAAVVHAARAALEAIAPIVLFRAQAGPESTLVNVVMADWTRVDLLLEPEAPFQRRDPVSLRAVQDPEGLAAALLPAPPDHAGVQRRVIWATEEFIRVLGLLPVALGRCEHVLATMGAGLLRDQLITLMKAEAGTLGEGMLHLSRSVSADDMAVLMALPVAKPNRDSVIAAHLALARSFIPRVQAFYASRGMPWPAAFEAATRAHLARALQKDAAALW